MPASDRQRPKRGWSRWFRSRILSIAVVSALSLAGLGAQLPAPLAAHASSIQPTGPAAAEDEFGNQYVFWRGASGHGNLYETYYNSYTHAWSGALDLGMGPLGSEPTVTTTNQVFAGPGGNEFSAQYVYWEGTNGGIFMAYWQGSWHGPIQLSDVSACSQPTATTVYPASNRKIVIFWRGLQGYCGQDNANGAGLYYTYSTTTSPTSAADYWAGPWHDTDAGLTASGPSVATIASDENITGPANGLALDDTALIAWQGQDGDLWTHTWNTLNGDTTSATRYSQAGLIGSVSAEAGVLEGDEIDTASFAWTGQDDNLWLGDIENGGYGGAHSLPSAGSPASAPTVAQAPGAAQLAWPTYDDEHVFYVGSDNNLWQADYSQAADGNLGAWSIQNLGDGPILP